MATIGQFYWPSVGTFVAAYGQFFMAANKLGWARDWIGKANREDQTLPVLLLRESAQHLGLIRKIKGRLVLPSCTGLVPRCVDWG